jgi:hypothetical protein
MASGLQSKPILNPELVEIASSIAGSAKALADFIKASGGIQWLFVAILMAFTIGLLVWYYRQTLKYETAVNIGRISRLDALAVSAYDGSVQGRTGIRAYLQYLKAQGTPDTHLCLTNFYVSTVNAAGLFFPAEDGIASPLAISSAVNGGARAFIFELWPDLTPGGNFAPIIQIVDKGSLWRRISMNSMPLADAMRQLVQQCFEVTPNPGSEDPVIVFLRFRGKPRSSTFTEAARALQSTIEPYRLDSTYYNCRSQETMYSTPMTALFKKVIVMSNTRAAGNLLSEYINIGPRDGIKTEWSAGAAKGLSADARNTAVARIQQNLCLASPFAEDPLAADNSANYQASLDIGIHMVGMNFWNVNDKLTTYMASDLFGKHSYTIKPEALRYIIEILPPPKYPQNPGWGSGPSAGTPVCPPALKLP